MKKSIHSALFFSTFLSLAYAGSEEECRKRAETLLYQKGFVNENVCLNLSHYPNISVNHDFGNIIAGQPDKAVPFKYLDSMSALGNLMHEMASGDKSSYTEVIGYTDGQKASFSIYDSQFTTGNETLTKPKEVDDYDSQVSKKITVTNRKKLNQKAYADILKSITDEASKKAIEEAYKNIPAEANGDRYLEFHKYTNGSLSPVGASGHFSDMMRNYLLSIDRGQKFCEKLSGEQQTQCQTNIKGIISPNLIKNRPLLKGDNVNGTCDDRRGVEYRFNFKDDHDTDEGSIPGEFSPNFKIPGRDLQNKMQVAASLDFINKLSKDPSFGPLDSSVEDIFKDPNLYDVEKDRERFRKLMAGTGCENNDYQIDNLRRAYWSINLKASELKSNTEINSRLESRAEDKQIFNAILSGDYRTLSSSPKAQQYLRLASLPFNDSNGYISQLQKIYGKTEKEINQEYAKYGDDPRKMHEKDLVLKISSTVNEKVAPEEVSMLDKNSSQYDPLAMEMIMLMRTAVIGKYPYNGQSEKKVGIKLDELKNNPDPRIALKNHVVLKYNTDILINIGDSSQVQFMDGFEGDNKITKKYLKATNKLIENKPTNLFPASPADPMAIAYTQTDINACNSSAAAILESIQNGEGQSMLRSNQAKGTKIYLGADQVNEVNIQEMTEDDLYKQMGAKTAKNFIKDGKGHGWICQECGSGLHVNIEDGSVQSVSRFRAEGNQKTEIGNLANKTVFENKQNNLTLASMQNLKIYEIPNCAGCNCLKQQSISNLDEYLKNNAQIHQMVQKENGISKIVKDKNTFEVSSNESCIFVPPVPHSCNFDPTGDSKEKNKEPKIWKHFYCKLEEKLKEKTGTKTTQKSLDEINNICSKKTFPSSEDACGLKLIESEVKSPQESGVGSKVKAE